MSGMIDRVIPRDHILQLVCERASARGSETAVSFITDARGNQTSLSWSDLKDRALRARQALKGRGLAAGDRILLSLPAGEAHLATVLGALWAGVAAATAHMTPQSAEEAGEDWRELIAALQPKLIVSQSGLTSSGVPVLSPDDLLATDREDGGHVDFGDLQPLSYIQFTSGSTGRPKGVGLEWDAIARNLEAITRGAPLTPEDHVVSWLPMYHDMGWFGGLLSPLYADCALTVMDVGLFVLNPLLWMKLIGDTRATITVTPPSALKTSLDLLRRRPPRELDLSSLRQVICGSEPVSPELVHAFNEILGPCGVPESALKPVYGLAEATLAVTFPPCSRPPRIDRIRHDALGRDQRATPANGLDEEGWVEQVSVGMPLAGISVCILDDAGGELPERRVGRIFVRSPSVMAAVMKDGGLMPWTGDWLDTGDLGYMADGELYVTGRSKDLIIKFGEKYAPDRLEELACRFDGVRRAAAFGVFDENRLTERVVLVLETRSARQDVAAERDSLRLAIRAEMQAAGYSVDDIRFVRKGSLPLTTSGKVRRWRCRELYRSGELARVAVS